MKDYVIFEIYSRTRFCRIVSSKEGKNMTHVTYSLVGSK